MKVLCMFKGLGGDCGIFSFDNSMRVGQLITALEKVTGKKIQVIQGRDLSVHNYNDTLESLGVYNESTLRIINKDRIPSIRISEITQKALDEAIVACASETTVCDPTEMFKSAISEMKEDSFMKEYNAKLEACDTPSAVMHLYHEEIMENAAYEGLSGAQKDEIWNKVDELCSKLESQMAGTGGPK